MKQTNFWEEGEQRSWRSKYSAVKRAAKTIETGYFYLSWKKDSKYCALFIFNGIFFFIVSAKNIFFILLIKQQEPQLKWSFTESKMSGTDNSNSFPKITLCAIFAWSKFKWIKTKYKEWERLTFNHLLSWLWDSALFCINCTSPEEFKLLLSLGGRGLKRMTKILI